MIDNNVSLKVVIAGAGSIGCFVGGMLANGGSNLHFFARPRIAQDINEHGLQLSDLTGLSINVTPQQFTVHTDASVLKDADLILICVKSKDTQEMAQTIKDSGNTHATIFSLQNGVTNTQTIQSVLTRHTVLPVMVPYNVVYQTGGKFHCGTEGNLYCQQHPKAQPLLKLAQNARLGFELKDDMLSILWGKLLLNLNNPINALAGIPLKQQLETAGFRKIYRDSLKEGLRVLSAAHIKPGKVAAVPITVIPYIMSLPTLIFKRIAQKMLAMDPKARSSMWEDLQNKRPVEVDYINGEIVKLGLQLNIPTPLNERLIELVKLAQQKGQGSPNLQPHQIRTP
jgi:2-dehydropantoate 2-reductase